MSIVKKYSAGLSALGAALALGAATPASAALFDAGIPSGWDCTGTCGALGADGVVPLAPGVDSGSQYGYVSTANGVSMAGLGLGAETTGSVLRSSLFSAAAGDALKFQFDFVTTDGAGYADYAWSRLLDASFNQVALLFTARTTPSGNSVPGFGMPAIAATINPSTVTIAPNATTWSPVGSGCYSGGCGNTGWVESFYNIANAGSYYLEFGTVNWSDSIYHTGLAFDGITVGGQVIGTPPVTAVPEPGTFAMLGLGLAGLGYLRRRKAAAV